MTAQIEDATRIKSGAPRTLQPAAESYSEALLLLRAPFALRCGALLIDYILMAGVLAVSTVFARVFGGSARSTGMTVETLGYLIGVIALVINLGLLPALFGQTIGKWATGLQIARRQSYAPIGIGRIILRHFVGYPLSLIPLGGGFLLALINPRGLALHDLLAGTIVVRRGEKRRARGVKPWGVR